MWAHFYSRNNACVKTPLDTIDNNHVQNNTRIVEKWQVNFNKKLIPLNFQAYFWTKKTVMLKEKGGCWKQDNGIF